MIAGKIAAHHLNKRNGVLIGDVVGLGKTLMATALARIMQDDFGMETLVICPKNLVRMWKDYMQQYGLVNEVLTVTNVQNELPDLRRFRLVIIDESHNLRNREGRRYKAIRDYIEKNESKCILLSATPYNKTYLDLSAQLRLFLSDEESRDRGIRPERLIREMGETTFNSRFQAPVRSLAAFEQSEYADDWRELMRLFLVRRTRSFIQENYAQTDPQTKRKFLVFNDGRRSYFPARLPRTVKFLIDDERTGDPYALLYADDVVGTINSLNLPRYGLANYIAQKSRERPTPAETKQLDNLSHAGKRLMGFCRTNLFKRLESGGPAFIQSIERHILRNYVFLHAIEEGLDLPLGTQDAELLDARTNDEDEDALLPETADENEGATPMLDEIRVPLSGEDDFRKRAAQVYARYAGPMRRRFKWLRPTLFNANLKRDLLADARGLISVLVKCGTWDADKDAKLAALLDLLNRQHANEKVLVATDVLSEGQNLQDGAIVVNYDLPWAIIRLIQRAGRVDRIGQQSDTIYCYSFLPAEGVERLIRLRERVRQRLKQNAEVVGTDEAFFEDELTETAKVAFEDLYNEKAGVLDGEADSEVDLASQAYQIWKNAIDANPRLRGIIERLPDVIFSTRAHRGSVAAPEGVLLYMRTSEGNDALVWVDRKGESVTQSQLAILRAAACSSDTPAIERPPEQHDLVKKGVAHIIEEESRNIGGQLGAPSGARRRTYERLKQFVDRTKDTLLAPSPELHAALQEIYTYPLQETAKDTLNRQLRSSITDDQLAELVINLRADNRLCQVQEQSEPQEPQIICSLGLFDDVKN